MGREDAIDAAKINRESQEYIAIQRFKMFFSGLIFAILSFIGVHPIHTPSNALRILEVISMFLLMASGIIILAQLNVAKIRLKKSPEKYSKFLEKLIDCINGFLRKRIYCFVIFMIGILLIVISRSIALFN